MSHSSARRFATVLTGGLFSLALATPAAADRVLLVNGEAFEDVLVVETGTQVRIRLEGGEMRLAKSQVREIEKTGSPYPTYLSRRAELEASTETKAGDWLDLARWALARDLRHSGRLAALEAARLDPHTSGLEPVLKGFGLVLDPETETWMPLGQHMARRGLVHHDGQWVRREERDASLAARAAEVEARRRILDDERRTRALEQVAATSARRQAAETTVVVVPMMASIPAPFLFLPSWPAIPGMPPVAAPVDVSPRAGGPTLDIFERQPGSLIPGTLNLDAPPRKAGRGPGSGR